MVEECKLRVVYVSPPQPPSPVPEGSEEGSSPRGSVMENGNVNGAEFSNVSTWGRLYDDFLSLSQQRDIDWHAVYWWLQAAKAFSEQLEPQERSAEVNAYSDHISVYVCALVSYTLSSFWVFLVCVAEICYNFCMFLSQMSVTCISFLLCYEYPYDQEPCKYLLEKIEISCWTS